MTELEPTLEQLSSLAAHPDSAHAGPTYRRGWPRRATSYSQLPDPEWAAARISGAGVWQEGTICFVTFRQARKARNLARNNGLHGHGARSSMSTWFSKEPPISF